MAADDEAAEQQRINQLKEELNSLRGEEEELARKIRELNKEELKALKETKGLNSQVNAQIAQALASMKESNQYAKERLESSKKYLDSLQKMADFEGRSQLVNEAKRDLLRSELVDLDNKINDLGDINEANEKEFKALLKIRDQRQKEADQLQKNKQLAAEAASASLDIGLGMRESAAFGEKLAASLSEGGGAAAGMYAFTAGMNQALGVAKGLANQITGGLDFSFTGLLSKMFELGLQFDQTIKNFERSTQLGDSFSESMQATAENTAQFGVSMEEASKAHMDLIQNTTVFTLATEKQRQVLADTAAVMAELGVATADFARGVENSMKFFGRSMAEAEEVQRELLAVARDLQVVPGELSAQFGKMGPQLAKFGDQGVEVFKELSAVAKQTGMEMEKILSITDKFDTFEGAAEMTGQLNAALGGSFVNAMDMMMNTDPVARFDSIRDAISSAGLSFDTMSYYQKQFFANSLGLGSVGDLALMMSGNLEGVAGASEMTAAEYAEMAEQAQVVQSVQEKFQAMIAKFFMENKDQIMAIIDGLSEFMQMLLENSDRIKFWIKMLISAKTAMASMAFTMSVLRTQAILKTAAIATATAAQAADTTVTAAGDVVKKASIVTDVAQTSGLWAKAGALWANVFASKALRVGLVGLVAGLVAFSTLGLLMRSPSLLVITLIALAFALYKVGIASKVNVPAITAFGVAAKSAGIGLALMGAGILAMAYGFSLLNIPQMLGMLAFLVALQFTLPTITTQLKALIPALSGSVIQIVAISLAAAVFAYAFSLIPIEGLATLIILMKLFPAAAAAASAGITALGAAITATAPAWGLVALILGIVAIIAVSISVALMGLFEVMKSMPASEFAALGAGFILMGIGMDIMAAALIALGASAQAAALGVIIATAAIVVISLSIAIVTVSIENMVLAFVALFQAINAEKMKIFAQFAVTLAASAPGLVAAGVGFGSLGIGMASFGTGLAFVSAEKLQSLATFTEGLAAINFSGFNQFTSNLGDMAANSEALAESGLPATITSIGASIATINPGKMAILNDTLVQMTNTSVEGLNALADAIRGIAEAMNSVPAMKAIAFTSVLASAAVAAVAIKVLQAGSAAVGGDMSGGGKGGGGGGFFGGGAAQASNNTIKVEISLDGELFEERVIEIARDESGRITREAIRNER
mgnify:FL=1|tara:strand:- start:9316 stop:12816 length:3501 start_codon:yes stop_codon:yes gene_type:complete